jgi:hypothetical protein
MERRRSPSFIPISNFNKFVLTAAGIAATERHRFPPFIPIPDCRKFVVTTAGIAATA